CIQQLSKISIAEQFTQLFLIDRQGLCPTFGQRRISVIDVIGDIAEQQRTRKRGWSSGVRNVYADAAIRNGPQRLRQRRHVEHVAQTFAVRLQQNREARIPRGHAQQIVGPLALLPQRRSSLGTASRQEQRAARGLSKLCREQRR